MTTRANPSFRVPTFILVLCAAALTACAAGPGSPPQAGQSLGARDRGEATARTLCASCHFVGRDGPSRRVDAPAFGEIAGRYADLRLDWELETISQVGHYAMPARPLSAAQIADLTAYIRSLTPEKRHPSKDEPGPGRPVVSERRGP